MVRKFILTSVSMCLMSLPVMAAEQDKPNFKPVSEAEYEKLLAESNVQNLSANLGPIAIAVDKSWMSDGNRVWTEFKIANLPNLSEMREMAHVVIEEIADKDGNSIADENFLQREKHTLMGQSHGGNEQAFIKLPLTLELKQENKVTDVAMVKGNIKLRLPIGIDAIKVTAADLGQEKKVGNHTFKLVEMKENDIRYEHSGLNGEAFRVYAYDTEGKAVSFQSSWRQELSGVVSESVSYQSAPTTLAFVIADKIVEKEYPFTLQ